MEFVSCYNNPKVVPEVFSEPSMTDMTAFEPLSVTIERQMAAGKMALEQSRGVYDFYNDGYIDPNRSDTGSYYAPDLVDMQSEYDSARKVFDASNPKSEPAKSESAKSEPAKSEPAKSEPAKSEPSVEE